MSISNVVLTDGITPETLIAYSNQNGNVKFRTISHANREVQHSLSHARKVTTSADRDIVRIREPLAVVNSDTGQTYAEDAMSAEINIRIPANATAAQRTAFVKRAFSVYLTAALEDVLVSGEGLV